MTEQVKLQQILGVDKKNPYITLWRSGKEPGRLYVFFGAAVMEVVEEDRDKAEFKLLIARLYNAGLKVKTLVETFEISRTTMKRWGDALKGDDPEELVRVLSGRSYPRKLTTEVLTFAEMRFKDIYKGNRYSYSSEIRKEIKEVFQKEVSGEALRAYFKKWKEAYLEESSKEENRANRHNQTSKTEEEDVEAIETSEACHVSEEEVVDRESEQQSPSIPSTADEGASLKAQEHLDGNREIENAKNQHAMTPNRKQTLLCVKTSGKYLFCHHVGVLLFSMLIARVNEFVQDNVSLVKQWIAAILLGAINIEQTKTLDLDALEIFFGEVMRNLFRQRNQLENMGLSEQKNTILKLNACLTEAMVCSDFYYDPHTKHYTGLKKILKGWCSRIRFADKVMHTDFVHTREGHPVYMAHEDNFHDLRERFFKVSIRFRGLLGFSKDKGITFIVDRGMYKMETFQKILNDEAKTYFITWEKGYTRDLWDEGRVSGHFHVFKPRNSAHDLRRYTFHYIDQRWKRNPQIRQVIVRATNPREKTIEVSILSNDLIRNAQELIDLMFNRWIQENDFKYLDNHFGINEITSYGAIHYKNLEKTIKDREVKSGTYKALETQKDKLSKQLASLLLQNHRSKKTSGKREKKIEEVTSQLNEVEDHMATTQKMASRFQIAVDEDFYKLKMVQKPMMDSIKILTRNMFYLLLQPFKELYNNYRDDHVLFRNLTRSHGCIRLDDYFVHVVLFPTAHYQPKVRKIVETVLEQINAANPPMPDNSGRILRFYLGKKEKNLFALG